jgi:quercetin dioxygenase-like cupin family protein
MESDYAYIGDLAGELEVPRDGILSRVLLKNDHLNVTLFGFSPGQELSEHTAGSPAVIHVLRGEATLTVAGDERAAGPGTWIYMPAGTPHGVAAVTPMVMLLLLLKSVDPGAPNARSLGRRSGDA